MQNPGLEAFSSDKLPESYTQWDGDKGLKVVTRKLASPPPMATPYTKGDYGTPSEPATLREDMEEPPPRNGRGATPGPGADNGQYGADPDPVLNHHEDNGYGQYRDLGGYWAHSRAYEGGAPGTQVPGEVHIKRPNTNSGLPLPDAPALSAMDQTAVADPNKAADERRKAVQQQVGGGAKENPAYERGQDQVDKHLQLRKLKLGHPLHRSSTSGNEMHDDLDMLPFEHAMGGQPDPYAGTQPGDFTWHDTGTYVPPIRHVDPRSPQYDTDYERGWNASQGYTGHEERSPLEEMDDSNASHAAYDGYMDYAVGRNKHHLRAVRRLDLNEPDDLPDEHWDHPEHVASVKVSTSEDDPRGEVENLINSLPEKAMTPEERPWTRATHQHKSTLAGLGFEQHRDDPYNDDTSFWVRPDGQGNEHVIAPSREEPRGGFWETSVGPAGHWHQDNPEPVEPLMHSSFDDALTRLEDPDKYWRENNMDEQYGLSSRRYPGKMSPFTPSARPDPRIESMSALHKRGESDQEFWERMEREHPGQQPAGLMSGHSADSASMEHIDPEDDYRDPASNWDDDDLDIPENMSLRDHAHLLRSGTMGWDGDTRYPKYTRLVNREIRDSDGRRAFADEGHVIEHNTRHQGPVLPTEDNPEPHPLEYQWTHTYYPAGQSDAEGLVKGYNSPDQALHATHQLALWGARHPESQKVLQGYRSIGSEMPYDPSEELPHETAMRENSRPRPTAQ